MNKLKKIISLLMIMTLIFSSIAMAEEVDGKKFSDLDEGYWAYESIVKLTDSGILDGYEDGTFRPDGNITRAEFVKIANQVFSYTQQQDKSDFTDIKEEDWFYAQVLIAQEAGYIDGYPDKTFKPANNITREELCKILVDINNFILLPFDKVPSDEVSLWAVDYVNKVLSNRIMTFEANDTFRATQYATRAEVCDVLAKFIIEKPEDIETPPSSGGGVAPGSGTGDNQELTDTMVDVIDTLKQNVVSDLEGTQQQIVEKIITNMEKYVNDNSHDYEKAAKNTYDLYEELSSEEKDELKTKISSTVPTKDLLMLKDFFFPDVEI